MHKRLGALLSGLTLMIFLTGCWSSREIEDLALYTGMALDIGQPAPTEKVFEAQGATYPKQDKVMTTLQVVPIGSSGDQQNQSKDKMSPFFNVSGSGDSILQIFRQFSIRLDRPIIGHHLKVIVISSELLKKQTIEQLTDFVLRDNDIRPSSVVLISKGKAIDTLAYTPNSEIPSIHLVGMSRNRTRTGKVLKPVTLANLDALIHSKRSFVLQRLVTGNKETEFSGAEIIKGSTGQTIGSLSEEETISLSWLKNEGGTGVIKVYDDNNAPLVYEIKSMKSKITPHVEEGHISFKVKIKTEGRVIETWSKRDTSTSQDFADSSGQLIQERLANMMERLIHKMQDTYQVDVGGFGERLSIKYPAVWRKVKDDWDEVFSGSEVDFTYDLNITDFGSFTETK